MKKELLFKKGDFVKIHPATDLFMRGVKYAEVVKDYYKSKIPLALGDTSKPVHIKSEMFLTLHKIHPGNLERVKGGR